jgi:fucose-1-phosphate guanylyltransferase
VISDPPGVKIGSGGSTLHCLEYLVNSFGQHSLSEWKVLIIHAGGFSQRFPSQSVLGKVFLTLPCSKYPIQMLEALLMMYINIPGKMNYGVSCTTSELLSVYSIFEYSSIRLLFHCTYKGYGPCSCRDEVLARECERRERF